MKLKKILTEMMGEDTWGNNPASGGSMSPGKTPNAVSPAPQPKDNLYDVGKDFINFEKTIEREEESASKSLESSVKSKLGSKKVLARSSKGSVGQTEQDYEINVKDVGVTYMGDKHYIVLTGYDDKDYYLNTTFKVRVLGQAETKDKKQTPTQSGRPSVGGITYPQNMGVGSNKSPGE